MSNHNSKSPKSNNYINSNNSNNNSSFIKIYHRAIQTINKIFQFNINSNLRCLIMIQELFKKQTANNNKNIKIFKNYKKMKKNKLKKIKKPNMVNILNNK